MSRAYGSRIETPKRKRRRPELGTARWRKVRRAVLVRDLFTCHWCGGVADEADHVVPVAEGGVIYDMDNVVASCGRDNRNRPPHDSTGCAVCSRWLSAYSGERGVHKARAYSVRSSRFSAGEHRDDAASANLSPLTPQRVVGLSRNTTRASGVARNQPALAGAGLSGDYSARLDNPVHKRVR